MGKKNLVIILLIAVGIALMIFVEGFISPNLRTGKEKYASQQNDPLTNDIDNLIKYKSKYIGDNSKFINLNYSLPNFNSKETFEIFPEKFAADINYNVNAINASDLKFKQKIVYNATANFVMIDNLRDLNMKFNNINYSISRKSLERFYNIDLYELQDKAKWNEKVQLKLKDKAFIDDFMRMFDIRKPK